MFMSMKMQSLLAHLKGVNERIQKFQPSGKEAFESFLNWASYDFMDRILTFSQAKRDFDAVYLYFEKLKDDSDYLSLLRDIFVVIKELNLILGKKEYLEAEQNRIGKEAKYFNCLKNTLDDELTVERFAIAVLEEKNYLKLGEKDGRYTVQDDFSYDYRNVTILKQFNEVFKFYRGLLRWLDRNSSEIKLVQSKLEIFQKLIYRLEGLLVSEPEKLHFRAYDWLMENICKKREPGNIMSFLSPLSEKDIPKIKENIRTVLEDLVLKELETEEYSDFGQLSKEKEILYRIKYNNQQILLNAILLAKTEFMGIPDQIFRYFYEHPNTEISMTKLKQVLKTSIPRKLPDIIKDLGFTAELKDMFFPSISSTAGKFINPITISDFRERQLSIPKFKRGVKKRSTEA